MEIATTTLSQAQGAASAATAETSLIGNDFNTFLVMLTTQLQNQDPLNPIESSDYAVQLATFSGVEQQVRTNQLLQGLAERMGLSGICEYSSWIGREALSDAPAVFTGAPLDLAFQTLSGTDSAQVVVYDAAGVEAGRMPIVPGQTSAVWSGEGGGGVQLPAGWYTFRVENFSEGESIGFSRAGAYATVTEVSAAAEGPTLVLSGGVEVSPTEIRALRA